MNVVANASEAQKAQAAADPTTLVLSPVATPVFASGLSEKTLGPLQQMLAPYNLRAMAGPGEVDGPAPALEPGSAVAVSLMEGDVNFAAVGTVTYVKGDTVLAFGHPFLGIGKVDMPMAPAYVHGVLSSAQASFKLASPMARTGRLYNDRLFAVAGKVGEAPKTVPVSMYLTDASRNYTRRYSVNMIDRRQGYQPSHHLLRRHRRRGQDGALRRAEEPLRGARRPRQGEVSPRRHQGKELDPHHG